MNELAIKELMRSKEENRIITSKISGIEDEYYKIKNENISCAILWYEDIKILIPSTHLAISKINKSMIRGMLGAFPKKNSGVIIQLNTTNITCLVRVPARFNNFPHFLDNVLIKVTEINEKNKLIYGYLIRII